MRSFIGTAGGTGGVPLPPVGLAGGSVSAIVTTQVEAIGGPRHKRRAAVFRNDLGRKKRAKNCGCKRPENDTPDNPVQPGGKALYFTHLRIKSEAFRREFLLCKSSRCSLSGHSVDTPGEGQGGGSLTP